MLLSPLEHLPRTGRLSPPTRRHDGQGFITMSFPTLLLLAVTPAAWHRVSNGVDLSNIPEGVAGPHRGQLLPAKKRVEHVETCVTGPACVSGQAKQARLAQRCNKRLHKGEANLRARAPDFDETRLRYPYTRPDGTM
ncbi:hypothetical protein LZ31DRAFT_245648 [Colletotrichum somersetense]|nr:hypothetical protein LZ31DRAFT_245648 [Colletotrichum somersetense]